MLEGHLYFRYQLNAWDERCSSTPVDGPTSQQKTHLKGE